MANIVVTMKDGKKHEHLHSGRAGGSYTKRLTFEGAFAIVEDEWGKRIAYPAADVESITETPSRW